MEDYTKISIIHRINQIGQNYRCIIKNSFNKNRGLAAFTLAEVLITLAILGVVSAITIPSLIQSTQNAQYASKLKKEFSAISQAYNSLAMDAGGSIANDTNFNCTGGAYACGSVASANAINEFATKMHFSKVCGSALGCWYNSPIQYLGGQTHIADPDANWSGYAGKAILTDGTIMHVSTTTTGCAGNPGTATAGSRLSGTICGYIRVDLNGTSKPNKDGRDVFLFYMSTKGIYPFGTSDDGNTCDVNSSSSATSEGCTAKVLTDGAMNY